MLHQVSHSIMPDFSLRDALRNCYPREVAHRAEIQSPPLPCARRKPHGRAIGHRPGEKAHARIAVLRQRSERT